MSVKSINKGDFYERIRETRTTSDTSGKVVGFYEDIVKLPSGKVVTWDLVKHKGAAAVVPVTDKGTILLVRQYRNALDQETLEIPAGGIEPGKHLWSVSQERLKKKQVLLLEK